MKTEQKKQKKHGAKANKSCASNKCTDHHHGMTVNTRQSMKRY